MIVVSNSYIPQLKDKIGGKDLKPIAITQGGDEAYYITKSERKMKGKGLKRPARSLSFLRKRMHMMYGSGSYDEDESDFDESEEEEDGDLDYGYNIDDESSAVKSFTGAEWKPNFIDRLTMFIAGVPGAGKSYLAKEMIKLLPISLPILLFSALEENDGNFSEKELGKNRIHKIRMTPDNLKNITLKEIRERAGSPQVILLFDDVDKIRDKRVQDLTFSIMNDALANGRGHEKHDGEGDLHVICTSHSLNDYLKTKYTFENSNYVALFPGKTPPLQMQRMFDKLGLDKELCKKMIRLGKKEDIRSIIIHKAIFDKPGETKVPMYIIFGNKIMLI